MHNSIYTLLFLLSFTTLCYSLPLSTNSRWIIDDHTRARVKLACVNWAGHLDSMLPEGLNKRPVGDIASFVRNMGFNCVRLTWATYMFTRFANLTVAQSFNTLKLGDAMEGISRYNPEFLNLTLVNAQHRVVDSLVREGLMVVLDNHVSKPSWCCSDHDGNGFFGDKYFDTKEWIRGLDIVGKRYKNTPMVVGMSLRNELRGPRQDTAIWQRYVKKGAKAINRANPSLLVIVSGLHYDLTLAFLKEKPLRLSTKDKLVYEVHRYAFTAGQANVWSNQAFSEACEGITNGIQEKVGFLMEGSNAAPLFLSEFGVKQSEVGQAESSFLGCLLGYLVEMDLDCSLWALQGSYYIRNGVRGPDETYGLLNFDWRSIRNPDFIQKLHLIQRKLQDPASNGPKYSILYHPWSGQCMRALGLGILVGDCRSFSRWIFQGSGFPVRLLGTGLCLSGGIDGTPTTLSLDCSSRHSQWELMSSSNYQVASMDNSGNYMCLSRNHGYESLVYTSRCMCLGRNDSSLHCQESPHTQWFKIVPANAL